VSKNYLLEMDEDKYFADPCDKPSLSQSVAHTLLSRSPYHAWLEHPKLGGQQRTATKAMDEGTILHSMLLGTDCKIEIIEHDDYRTDAAKLARDTAILNGYIPVKEKDHERLQSCVTAVKKQLLDYDISLIGQKEGVLLWIERDYKDRAVYCKARVDCFDGQMIIDLKSTGDAHPDAIKRRIVDGGYHTQAATYIDAIARQHPDLAGKLSSRDIFFETEPPYLVTVVELADSFLTLGRQKWTAAINLWSQCLHENHWPAYGQVCLEAPAWAIAREMDGDIIV